MLVETPKYSLNWSEDSAYAIRIDTLHTLRRSGTYKRQREYTRKDRDGRKIRHHAHCLKEDRRDVAEISPHGTEANTWHVSIHPLKTTCMLFSCKHNPSTLPAIKLGVQSLDTVPSHRHLGIILNSTLTWSTHIAHTTTKCNRLLAILRKFKHRWSKDSLSNIYKTIICPALEYGDILYDSCTVEEGRIIENTQLEAARIVTGAKRGTSHNELYNETGWIPLQQRRHLRKLRTVHRIVTLGTPIHLHSLVLSWQPSSSRPTRFNNANASGLITSRSSTAKFRNSPLISSITFWNT